MPGLVLLDLARQRRPRPDETHLTAHHVPELGYLVQAAAPQQAPDTGEPGILLHLEQGPARLVLGEQLVDDAIGILPHRAELQDLEARLAAAHALLAEEHGAR